MIVYEWDLETVDEYGDILDHDHNDKARLPRCDQEVAVLVRDVWDAYGDLVKRSWAYPDEAGMPEFFDCGARVPKRYRNEWARLTSAA